MKAKPARGKYRVKGDSIMRVDGHGGGPQANATRAVVDALMKQANGLLSSGAEFNEIAQWTTNSLASAAMSFAMHCSQQAPDQRAAALNLANLILEEARNVINHPQTQVSVGSA